MISDISKVFAKTKILATLGPATAEKETIKRLMEAGLDGVRLNFSHGDYSTFEKYFKNIHEACVEENSPLAVLLDLQGPKIRIGELLEPSFEINNGEKLEISVEDFLGTKNKVSTSYKPLPNDAKIGDTILIDDGLIRLTVVAKTATSVICEVINGGILKPKKGMNLPGMKLSTNSITEKDYRDLEFAMKHRLDYVALSFVREAKDILELRDWLRRNGKETHIIAKIEKPEAVENFEEILNVSDGIMVARGDLGVECAAHEVPIIQKNIISRCNAVGKLVITATQMLESMIHNPVPTRAEASDVANAVWDGTDVVMLSGETSVGKYPLKAVTFMNDIVKHAENSNGKKLIINYEVPSNIEENLFDSFNKSIVSISEQVGAAAIVTFTKNGRTAMRLSKFKPKIRIIAISDSFETMNRLCLKYGITSLFSADGVKESAAIDGAKKMIVDSGHVKKGDIVLFTAGAPYSEKSRINWLKFEVIN